MYKNKLTIKKAPYMAEMLICIGAYLMEKHDKVEVKHVEKQLLTLSSITYAMKAQQVLSEYGISSYVERISREQRKSSCGYALYVPHRIDEAERLLIRNGIRVTGREYRGDIL